MFWGYAHERGGGGAVGNFVVIPIVVPYQRFVSKAKNRRISVPPRRKKTAYRPLCTYLRVPRTTFRPPPKPLGVRRTYCQIFSTAKNRQKATLHMPAASAGQFSTAKHTNLCNFSLFHNQRSPTSRGTLKIFRGTPFPLQNLWGNAVPPRSPSTT